MGEPGLEELERIFKALANINRLRLIVELQRPKGYAEIDLAPSRGDSAGSEDRSISRQAVRGHIQELMELGIVVEVESEAQRSVFVVDHTRLFALLERVRSLAALQPEVDLEAPSLELKSPPRPVRAEGPHLVLVRGVQEGRAFEFDEESGETAWTLGRDKVADISLDYDAYVCSEHARILHQEDRFYLMDIPQNKNGTFLNGEKLSPGGVEPLGPGDIVGVGRSLLVFRG